MGEEGSNWPGSGGCHVFVEELAAVIVDGSIFVDNGDDSFCNKKM